MNLLSDVLTIDMGLWGNFRKHKGKLFCKPKIPSDNWQSDDCKGRDPFVYDGCFIGTWVIELFFKFTFRYDGFKVHQKQRK